MSSTASPPDGYLLHQFITSPYCAKVRLALQYKKLHCTVRNLGISLQLRRQLAELGPGGTLPVLQLPGGENVQGSGAILRRLEQMHPDSPLYPDGDVSAAEIRVMESWADESLSFLLRAIAIRTNALELLLSELLQPLSAPLRFLTRLGLRRRMRQRMLAQGIGRRPLHDLLAELNEHLHSLEVLLAARGWLAGSRFTAADAAVGGQFSGLGKVAEIAALLSQRPLFSAWLKRIEAADVDAVVTPAVTPAKTPAATPAATPAKTPAGAVQKKTAARKGGKAASRKSTAKRQ